MLLTSIRHITRPFISSFRAEQIIRFASSSKSDKTSFCAQGGTTCTSKVDNPCSKNNKKDTGKCDKKCPDDKPKNKKGKAKKSAQSGQSESKPEKEKKPASKESKNYVYGEDRINEECIDFPCCPDPPQKYDEEFKKEIDERRKSREYRRTWVECPPKRTVEKVVCEGKPQPPSSTKSRVPTGLSAPAKPDSHDGRCQKITMPGCKAVIAEQSVCKKEVTPSDCKKVEAPYKSYSECNRDRPPPRHPTECGCLEATSLCKIFGKKRKTS